VLAPQIPTDLARFAIGFDQRDRERLHALWNGVLDAERWSEGTLTAQFEAAWARWNDLEAVAFNGWTGAALTDTTAPYENAYTFAASAQAPGWFDEENTRATVLELGRTTPAAIRSTRTR